MRPGEVQALDVNDTPVIQVGAGCRRRDLPVCSGVRSWVVEIDAGFQWPYVDEHGEGGEVVFVLEGELIEGNERFGAGACITFGPNTRHQPRSERGVRLFGFNPAPPASQSVTEADGPIGKAL